MKIYTKLDEETLRESEDTTIVNTYRVEDIKNRIAETEAKITELTKVLADWKALKLEAEKISMIV